MKGVAERTVCLKQPWHSASFYPLSLVRPPQQQHHQQQGQLDHQEPQPSVAADGVVVSLPGARVAVQGGAAGATSHRPP